MILTYHDHLAKVSYYVITSIFLELFFSLNFAFRDFSFLSIFLFNLKNNSNFLVKYSKIKNFMQLL